MFIVIEMGFISGLPQIKQIKTQADISSYIFQFSNTYTRQGCIPLSPLTDMQQIYDIIIEYLFNYIQQK